MKNILKILSSFSFLLFFLLLNMFSFFISAAYANESVNLLNSSNTSNFLSENPSIKYNWQRQNIDNAEVLILHVQYTFSEGTYTYAPDYKDYPTKFNSLFPYTLFYPNTKKSYDSLTKKSLELYKNTVDYYLYFDNETSEQLLNTQEFQVNSSFLICSSTNCMPVKKIIKARIPENYDEVELISTDIEESSKYKSLSIEAVKDLNSSISAFGTSTNTMQLGENTNSLVPINNNAKAQEFKFTPRNFSSSLNVESFGIALVFGFIAGLILNLMPCVLPVIAIKIASLMQMSNQSEGEQDKLIRIHGLFFALGVLTLFGILAILFGAFGFIWGALFQSVYFIIVLSGFLFLLGLSFLGMFTFPLINIRAPKEGHAYFDSYFQGLVITLIATPCSGPLLGGVLGFSLTLPLYLLVVVFLATGLGMAFPYLLLVFYPRLVRFIPRSGNWSLVMEQALAFMLFATSLYLISLLSEDAMFEALVYNFFVAFFVWLYTFLKRRKHALLWAIALYVIHTGISAYVLTREEPAPLEWQTFSAESFQEDLSKKPMLVTFTAEWCPTCKILENSVLTKENIQPLVEEYGLELIKVDMTYANAEQEALLRSLHSASIPLLALFPEGIFAYSPIVLRDIYTLENIEEALEDNL